MLPNIQKLAVGLLPALLPGLPPPVPPPLLPDNVLYKTDLLYKTYNVENDTDHGAGRADSGKEMIDKDRPRKDSEKLEILQKPKPFDPKTDKRASCIDKDLNYPLMRKHIHGGEVVKHGYGIIIVNKNIKGQTVREGAKNDISHLERIYDQYSIAYEGNVHFDLTGEEMNVKLEDFSDNVPVCPVIFVSLASHGGLGGVIAGTDGEGVTMTQLIQYFISNKNLLGIPKVFLIQACRDNHMEAHYNPSDEKVYKNTKRFTTKASDVLIAYATSGGTTAFRSSDGGASWFIEKLYECVTDERYRDLHFVEILTICSDRIIEECHAGPIDEDVTERRTESSSYTSTLRKFLRFPVKDLTL